MAPWYFFPDSWHYLGQAVTTNMRPLIIFCPKTQVEMIFWWGNLSRESLCPKTQLDIWGNLAKAIWATWKTARKRSWQTKRLSSSLGSTILSTTTVFDIILKPSPDAVKGPKFSEANFGLLPTKLGPRKVEKRCFVYYRVSREVAQWKRWWKKEP